MEPIPEVCEDSYSQIGDEDEGDQRKTGFDRRGAAHSYETLCSRCKATGSVQIVTVHAGDCEIELHKCPLVSRSGYLTRIFRNSSHFVVPPDFPGGPPAFDLVVRFCLGFGFTFDPSNVAILRCAAEYLEMNRELASNNLCERAELYLYHVALREWAGAIQVIRSVCTSEALILLAEDTQIVSRCVDAIASMLSAEFRLNPCFRSRVLEPHSGGKGRWRNAHGMSDLLRLPFPILTRIITACRRRGVAEPSICHLLVKYVEKWLFAERFTDGEDEDGFGDEISHMTEEQMAEMLECIVRLLPFERGSIPVSFLFALLRYSIAVGSSRECRMQIESRIASQLDLIAGISDLLMPFKSAMETPTLVSELDSMKRIVSLFMMQNSRDSCTSAAMVDWQGVENVGRIWDEYLAEIAYSSSLSALRFADLIDAVPAFVRVSHDELYRAILVFLKAHPSTSQQEKTIICKSLDCQKLSQEACIHVVQNETMPLRTIVQAMFAQQVYTRSVMNHSLRFSNNNNSNLSKAFLVEENRNQRNQMQGMSCEEIPLMTSRHGGSDETCELKADLEATNSKLVSLEKQLLSIKQTLQGGSEVSSSGLTATTTTSTSSSDCHPATTGRTVPIVGRSSIGQRKTIRPPCENPGVGRKITKAFQKIGLASGLCKQQTDHHHITPERCFQANPTRTVYPQDEEQLLEPPRLSVGKDGRRRRRYSIS